MDRQKGKRYLLLSVFFCLSLIVVAGSETVLRPASKNDYGSGATISQDIYYPGGIPNTGLFLGNPNDENRRDRALFRYDLTSFLIAPERVKKVELAFNIYFCTGKGKRLVVVERFLHPIEKLNGAVLTDPEVEMVQTVEISSNDGDLDRGGKPPAPPKRIDVTKFVKSALDQGFSSITFRFKDGDIDSPQGPTTGDSGIVIESQESHLNRLPTLTVTREN